MEKTSKRLNVSLSVLNLYLAALLVIKLTLKPSFDNYFNRDTDGIFGSVWMQQHFTRHKWDEFYAHTHLNPDKLTEQLNKNIKSC